MLATSCICRRLYKSDRTTYPVTARISIRLQDIACNCKNVHVTAFLDCSTSWWGGDAASRRGEEIECNITSNRQDCLCNDAAIVMPSRLKQCPGHFQLAAVGS
jgi:hypothetical protein